MDVALPKLLLPTRRPNSDLIGDIIGGALSGAAFLRLCLGTGITSPSSCAMHASTLERGLQPGDLMLPLNWADPLHAIPDSA